ncbi:MAG: carbohydrate kinase family protein [Candidatus Promineifilaceae bacterium]
MILCCGEALIDFVPLAETGGYKPCPGGSVYNIAVGLGRLAAPAGFFSQISRDFFGDQLLAYLRANHVDTSYCLRSDDPTTLAFVSLPEEGSEPRFMFYANDAADRRLLARDLPELSQTVTALHFGSISLVLKPGATALETLMRRESRRRILSLDPNVRPGLIHNRDAYHRHFEEWVKLVDIIKLSRADFEYIYPHHSLDAMVARWLDAGASLCLVTMGEDGAVGYTSSGVTAAVTAPRVKVADTVGAGDTFLAAALAYLHTHHQLTSRKQLHTLPVADLAACLTYAVRAAAINCMRQGADPPTLHEMESIHV